MGIAEALAVIFFTSLIVGFSGAMAPGPLSAVNVRDSITKGPKTGLTLSVGHSLAELMILLVLLLGIGPFLSVNYVEITIGLIGGLFLLYLSYASIHKLKNVEQVLPQRSGKPSMGKSGIYLGFIVSLANPYFIIWWSTIGLSYISWSDNYGIWGVGCFFIGHITSDFIWNISVSIAVFQGGKLMSPAVFRIVMVLLNICLGMLGAYFIFKSLYVYLG